MTKQERLSALEFIDSAETPNTKVYQFCKAFGICTCCHARYASVDKLTCDRCGIVKNARQSRKRLRQRNVLHTRVPLSKLLGTAQKLLDAPPAQSEGVNNA